MNKTWTKVLKPIQNSFSKIEQKNNQISIFLSKKEESIGLPAENHSKILVMNAKKIIISRTNHIYVFLSKNEAKETYHPENRSRTFFMNSKINHLFEKRSNFVFFVKKNKAKNC